MPVNVLLTFVIGSALAWVLLIITRPPQHLKGLIIGACAAGKLSKYFNRLFYSTYDYRTTFYLIVLLLQ